MLQKLNSFKYYLIVGAICLTVGFLSKPHPTKIVTKTEIVEKIVTKVVYQKAVAAKKKKILVTNKDGSSILTETTDTKSATNYDLNQVADINLKESTVQKFASKGVGLMADFDKNNRYEGLNLDGHWGYGKAKMDFDQLNKYNGWGIGIQYNF